MAIVNIYNTANSLSFRDLVGLDFDTITVTTVNSTTIAGTSGSYAFSMGGTFIFGASGLTGGTLQTFTISFGGALIGRMIEINRDVLGVATAGPPGADPYLLSGNDTVVSEYNENDLIRTYGGNDVITAGTGNDRVFGGAGIDTMVISDSFTNAGISDSSIGFVVKSASGRDTLKGIELLRFDDVTMALSKGTDLANNLTGDKRAGFREDFILALGGDDTVLGLLGNDHLNGGIGHDTLKGGKGRDTLLGGTGRDTLVGGSGGDVLKGHDGRDRLIGGQGDDMLTGGKRADHFVFAKGHGDDTITDFVIGQDLIEIGRGAAGMRNLTFSTSGTDVIVAFADVTVTVEDVTLSALKDIDNFVF